MDSFVIAINKLSLRERDQTPTTSPKTNKVNAFTYRSLKGCPPQVQGLVCPVEYASMMWDPYKQHVSKTLKSVQHCSNRRIFRDFSRTTNATGIAC